MSSYIRNYFKNGETPWSWWSSSGTMNLHTPTDLDTFVDNSFQCIFDDGKDITGDFSLVWGWKQSDTVVTTQNMTVFTISESGVNGGISCFWDDGQLIVVPSGPNWGGTSKLVTIAFFDYVALKEIAMKIERIGSDIKVYYYNGGWVDTTYAATYSGAVANISGAAEDDKFGYTYFDFLADAGFPNIPLSGHSQANGQLAGQINGQL